MCRISHLLSIASTLEALSPPRLGGFQHPPHKQRLFSPPGFSHETYTFILEHSLF